MHIARSQRWPFATVVASAATTVLVIGDGWRTASLVLIAAGAVLATRVRYAGPLAIGLVSLAALLVLAGLTIGGDPRPEHVHVPVLPVG